MIDNYLEYLDRQGKSHHTYKAYRQALRHFARWYQQSYDDPFIPNEVSPRDVVDWLSYQRTVQQAKPHTVNQRLTALRNFFKWCISKGYIQSNPTDQAKYQPIQKHHPKALSEKETKKLLKAAYTSGNRRDIAIIELMLGTGLRREELLNLCRGDVEIKPRSGRVVIRSGKGEKYREVPLSRNVRAELTAYLSSLDPQLKIDDPLWRGQRGPLKDPKRINEMIANYAMQARIGHVTPHQLRHTFATRYLEANPDDLRGLAAILGHTSLDTVMIYTEPTTEAIAERIERMDL